MSVDRVRTEARALERTTDTGATVPCVAARRAGRRQPVDWVRVILYLKHSEQLF